MNHYDIIVIGCGAAGYNTAIRASQLGFSVACVERASQVGGAGIQTDCIPSRLLLHASGLYEIASTGTHSALGVDCMPALDLARMMTYKKATVEYLATNACKLLHKRGVTVIHGNATLAGAETVAVTGVDRAPLMLSAKTIVIATGSEPIPLPFVAFDHQWVLHSADALALDHVPKHLAIVGAGAVGVELGSIWHRLGSRVTLLERRDRICHWLDRDVAATLQRTLEQQGIGIRLSTDVIGLEKRPDGVSIRFRTPEATEETTLDAELALVAIGRRPSTAGLNLEAVGIRTDTDGALPPHPGPEAAGIWVVGDAASGPMLMSKAEEEAIACAEQIAGLPGFVNYASIPNVLYTSPEVAMIGKTEEALRDARIPYRVGYCPLAISARAAIYGTREGSVKLLVDARTNLIASAHLIGPGAVDLISQVAVAMEASMICEDFARICHPYPAWSEALRQAAMAAGGWMMRA